MLVLASASPRRHELLVAAGIPHSVRPGSVPENRHPAESATDFVRRLAAEKARAVPYAASEIVLGADTVVCVDDEVFGKPANPAHAEQMLSRLSGRDHLVHTGICLLSDNCTRIDIATTRVSFIRLSAAEIREYTRSGEPLDKAGAYGIQGRASKFISSIQGCYHNVVGLPVSLVYQCLKQF